MLNLYRPNAMMSSISVAINELSLIENLTDNINTFISENRDTYDVYAFDRGGKYFGVDCGYFVPQPDIKLESLKECVVFILKENKNLVFSVEKENNKVIYKPGVYFNDSIECITYLENKTPDNIVFYDIKRKEYIK